MWTNYFIVVSKRCKYFLKCTDLLTKIPVGVIFFLLLFIEFDGIDYHEKIALDKKKYALQISCILQCLLILLRLIMLCLLILCSQYQKNGSLRIGLFFFGIPYLIIDWIILTSMTIQSWKNLRIDKTNHKTNLHTHVMINYIKMLSLFYCIVTTIRCLMEFFISWWIWLDGYV